MAALGMALTFALPSAAHAQIITPPPVPTGLEVDAPNEAFLLGRGVGTQNYICQPAALGRVAWTLFTPQATLFSDEREQLITHFSSPNPDEGGVARHVEHSQDTSTVWAQAIAVATVKSTAIPWVKLQVVGAQDGPNGGDTLSGTTFIQRLNTEGGWRQRRAVTRQRTSVEALRTNTWPITTARISQRRRCHSAPHNRNIRAGLLIR